MSKLSPQNEVEFRASCARLINMPEFQTVLKYMEFRLDTIKDGLVDAHAVDVPKFQGRANELTDLLKEIRKKKE
jgi:hypothetical protein